MIVGVGAALLSTVLLALGAQFQGRGVRGVEDRDVRRSGPRRVLDLVRSRGWLLGTSFLALAILLQLVGLLLAPLPVVQPLGVLSLVVTALLSHRLAHARIQRWGAVGIAVCVTGTTAFVVTAAFVTTARPEPPELVLPVLVLVGSVLLALLAGYALLRHRAPAVAFAVAGGVCFGFVATLMKVVLDRGAAALRAGHLLGPGTGFTLLVLAAAGAGGLAGISLVQRAYRSGSPDLVVAALTVVDPLVAVTLGIALLGQARHAPPWSFAVFGVAELVAIAGVVLLATHPPKPDDTPGRVSR